jgi:hypothetical protein
MRRLSALICLTAALGPVTSCSLTFRSIDDDRFRAVWSPDWAMVAAATKPLAPSATGPGVCNAGGDKMACFRTSHHMIDALSKLDTDLAAVQTPREYHKASTTIRHAVQINIKALTDRANAIKDSDDTLWTASNNEIQQAEKFYGQGYAEFPPETRPTPKPFQ